MNAPNPKIDAFIDRATRWQEEMRELRSVLLDWDLAEELKWGSDWSKSNSGPDWSKSKAGAGSASVTSTSGDWSRRKSPWGGPRAGATGGGRWGRSR